ncbi:hypothetical protein [Fluviicola chungangensis]|uniref:Lipoprotein n=1 Tax=Fluviicola chungangensis TaxID=2597671 RepID=A0A556N675_9FLAO|nr:hypothetical protein [Fluviicola chungangensis]TSJ47573.1 hypothetical protein FO442_00150 [Fluviicola chungangensis]
MGFIKRYQLLIPAFIVGVSLFFSCTKEKTPTPVTPEPTKWEKIAGHYKVYDTTGVYLYDMDLIHIHVSEQIDSLRFENFDSEFTFTVKQLYPSPMNFPMCVSIGGHDTLYDSNSKRWKLSAGISEEYNNFRNDTIHLNFQKTNINYYISDLTAYYACNCKQIAVKQH